jgi:hypothetical protein
MTSSQKSLRDMIVDRLVAADINTGSLAIEAAGESVRVTGSVRSEDERNRVIAVLNSAQASGVRVSHEIEIRPGETPARNEEPSADIRFPPEPA